MSSRVAIGVGCRRGCGADVIERLVSDALDRAPGAQPLGLFTIAHKRGEAGLATAATRLGLDLVFLPSATLEDCTARVQTRSPRAETLFGVASVSEAAALAGAGPGAVIVVARIAKDGATCAIAGLAEPAV